MPRVAVPVSHSSPRCTTAVIRGYSSSRGGRSKFRGSQHPAATTPFTRGLIGSPRESTRPRCENGTIHQQTTTFSRPKQQIISPSSTLVTKKTCHTIVYIFYIYICIYLHIYYVHVYICIYIRIYVRTTVHVSEKIKEKSLAPLSFSLSLFPRTVALSSNERIRG